MGDHEPVGVIGLGLMGRPVAASIARAGLAVFAWNRSPVTPPDGVALVDSVTELGRRCPTVLVVLPDLPQLAPLLGTQVAGVDRPAPTGLLSAGHRVHTLVVMSTCSPVAVRELAAALAPRGVDVLDAPMSGGVLGAQQATLSIMVGGAAEALERVRPVLDAAASTVTRLGEVGAGSIAKACNQLVVAATLTALAEAMVLAEREGLDRDTVLGVLSGGLAASEVLRQKRHALASDDFTPSGPARYLLKDLGFASDVASVGGGPLPVLGALHTVFEALVAQGLGDLDAAAVLQTVRQWRAHAPQ
ncbi:MAG: NAD(P)-dependent oxidoreductase [Dermatophilaceae bacterium]